MGRRAALIAVAVCLSATAASGAAKFRLTSPAFQHGKAIPVKYTCTGANVSPALRWTAPPARTRSFALEMHDPDAPVQGGFTHWLAWGFPASARGLASGKRPPIEGANGTGMRAYMGPCPPTGVHRYRFTLYALDAPLRLKAGAEREDFHAALKGHVRGRAVLIGLFGN